MDTAALRTAFTGIVDAAASVTSVVPSPEAPAGEWDADEILAHVSLVTAATIAAASCVAAGVGTTYDNRAASDLWTIHRLIARTDGATGLRERIEAQADAVCALVWALGEPELETLIPTLLLSGGAVLVDQPLPLGAILAGLAEGELPGHRRQLLALLPSHGQSATGS